MAVSTKAESVFKLFFFFFFFSFQVYAVLMLTSGFKTLWFSVHQITALSLLSHF